MSQVLGKNHVIKDLKKCDFTAMYDHAMAERERKKQLSKEVCMCTERGMLVSGTAACGLCSCCSIAEPLGVHT